MTEARALPASRRPAGRVAVAAAILLVWILFVAVNVLTGLLFPAARLDLTEDRLYTLSSTTERILGRLEEPVTLRLFYSRTLGREAPAYGTYAARVRELLGEYERVAEGRVRVEVIDPAPFSDAEDRALAYDLQPIPLGNGESAYLGLVGTNMTDDEQVIALLRPDREPFLEHDLTKLVLALAEPRRTVVGLLSGLPLVGQRVPNPMPGQPAVLPPWEVLTQLRQLFEVRTLRAPLERIDPAIDVLMIVHPKDLQEATLYAIDQYLLAGGRALVFVDPHSEVEAAQGGRGGGAHASDLAPLLAAWGVAYDAGHVVGDRAAARKVTIGQGPQARAFDYPAWIALRGPRLARDDPATAQLDVLNLAAAGTLRPADGRSVAFAPLVTASPGAGLLPVEKVRGRPDPAALARDIRAAPGSLVVAARLSGEVPSAFPAGPPSGAPAAGHRASGRISVAVIADTDLLFDQFWLQRQSLFGREQATPIADNADLVANLIETLSGSEELLALRGRGTVARPFTRIEALRRDAEAAFHEREQAIRARLAETEKRLADLQGAARGSGRQSATGAVLSPEQTAALAEARRDLVRARGELRAVQRSLREELDRIERRLALLDIALMPALVALAGLAAAWTARLRRRRAERSA